ncbi:MAG: hypothetical protein ACK5LR_02810 [Mangrovibacterium sp.]
MKELIYLLLSSLVAIVLLFGCRKEEIKIQEKSMNFSLACSGDLSYYKIRLRVSCYSTEEPQFRSDFELKSESGNARIYEFYGDIEDLFEIDPQIDVKEMTLGITITRSSGSNNTGKSVKFGLQGYSGDKLMIDDNFLLNMDSPSTTELLILY